MATFEMYRRSSIGMCLTETLDEMVSSGTLSPELAIQVLVQFDQVGFELSSEFIEALYVSLYAISCLSYCIYDHIVIVHMCVFWCILVYD